MTAISVIVPIYNIEAYLGECLDSIARQDFADFEALCVIDGGEDGSIDIARDRARRDERFRVLAKDNGGLSSARNYGLDHARGDIVVFVDGDDAIEPHCLRRINAVMADTGADVLVFGASPVPAEASTEWLNKCLFPSARQASSFSPDFMFSDDTTPYVWRNAVRRRLIEDIGLRFDEDLPFGEDVAFQFALYPQASLLASIPDKLYRYRLERSGSLMDGRRGPFELMKAHGDIVEAVFRSWKELGLLDVYPRELFAWSVPYLTRSIDQVSADQRAECLEAANQLWGRYYPDAGQCAAHAVVSCVCRGDGKLYAELTVNAAPFASLVVSARADGAEVPVGAYPISRCDGGGEQVWALELPWMAVPAVTVLACPDGRACEQVAVTLRYRKAKWLSRFNYRARPERCRSIRDVERPFTFERFQVGIDHRFRDGDDAIWRFRVRWVGAIDAEPRFSFIDGRGVPLNMESIVLEYQPAPEGSLRENLLFVSVRTSHNHFIMVVSDAKGTVGDGFAVVDPSVDESHRFGTAEYMKAADSDDAAYARWLDGHRAGGGELQAQRRLPAAMVSFCVVLDACEADIAACEATLRTLAAQTHESWSAIVLGCQAPVNPETIPEGFRTTWLPAETGASRFDAAIARADADYVIVLTAGDALEPNALYELAYGARDSADVVYADEDVRTASGTHCNPRFKTGLNLDLLYSSDWLGSACALRRELLLGMSQEESYASAWRYDKVLRAYELGARFQHVPRVILHACQQDARDGCLEARRIALAGHLARRGIDADVSVFGKNGDMRIRYLLPETLPLVSIVIPSKDQADLLEACVRSLAYRSSYRSFEVIVVENNSEREDTAARYAALERDYPQVRIVHWPGAFNYSGIVNFGATHAKGDLLLFLNNDTELIEPDSIAEMVGLLQRPEVGVVGAKLLFKDGLVQHAGITVHPSGGVVHVNQNRGKADGGYQGRACLTGDYTAVTGACQMVRRAVFEELGGYDERFAVGFNDVDFCLRLQQAGYLATFTPYAQFYHYEFASRGRELVGDAKMLRWKRESALFMELWPELFVEGDPYTSPHLLRGDVYYRLP